MLQHSEVAIRRAVDSVFAQPEFRPQTLWERFVGWLGDAFYRLWDMLRSPLAALRDSPPAFWLAIAVLVLIVVGLLVRVISLWIAGRQARRTGGGRAGARLPGDGRDPWLVAEELAARGSFTAAAHALYAALLAAAAREQQIRLHPSKTAGDYVRELGSRSSSLFPAFRDFTRSYERVIYGLGACDAARYGQLHALAIPIVRPGERG